MSHSYLMLFIFTRCQVPWCVHGVFSTNLSTMPVKFIGDSDVIWELSVKMPADFAKLLHVPPICFVHSMCCMLAPVCAASLCLSDPNLNHLICSLLKTKVFVYVNTVTFQVIAFYCCVICSVGLLLVVVFMVETVISVWLSLNPSVWHRITRPAPARLQGIWKYLTSTHVMIIFFSNSPQRHLTRWLHMTKPKSSPFALNPQTHRHAYLVM